MHGWANVTLIARCARYESLEQQLRGSLSLAQQQAAAAGLLRQAARMFEALGRIAYQTGDYLLATEKWTRAVDLAELVAELRISIAARIGLGQIHYAMGAWDKGRRFHRDAANLLSSLDDSYLEAKLALNQGVGNYENAQLEEAEHQFSKGLAAARRGQHLEFEAEALWHLARAALLRGFGPSDLSGASLAGERRQPNLDRNCVGARRPCRSAEECTVCT